jgi:hypothetical protein
MANKYRCYTGMNWTFPCCFVMSVLLVVFLYICVVCVVVIVFVCLLLLLFLFVCCCYCFCLFVVVLFFIVLCFMPNISCVSELLIIDWPFVFLYVFLIPVLICFVVQACAYCIIQLKPFLSRFFFGCCWNIDAVDLHWKYEYYSQTEVDHRNALRYTT